MHMRKTWIGVVVAGVVALGLLAGCKSGQPAIDLPQTEHNFGEVQQGDVATVQLPVRNTGNSDLHIESVATSCGCTSAKVEPMTIPPNGEATLTVNYNSGLHPDEGPIFRIIYIDSDDPQMTEATVEIRADVKVP